MMDLEKIRDGKSISELLEFSIINVDKHSGITSFRCADRVRKILGLKKSGHFGTLDMNVSGVLPVALNRACKLSNYFMKKDKEYVGKMRLHSDVSEDELKKEMEKFVGKIMQKPPVKSRVKRVLRERSVNKFRILKFHKSVVEFHADVEAGTYIRKLISDLGEKIGGAHMVELRRVRAGIFNEKDSWSLEEIGEAFEKYGEGDEKLLRKILIPAEIVNEIVPAVFVGEESVEGLLNGKPLMKSDMVGDGFSWERVSVFCEKRFIGIYRRVDEGDIIGKTEWVMN